MANLIDVPKELAGLREKCLDFAVRIFEARGKDLIGSNSGLSDEAISMAMKFEEYINSRK